MRPRPITLTPMAITLEDDATAKTACKKPEGKYVLQGGDTDDGDDNVNPGCTKKFYLDTDNDGEGDPNTEVLACNLPVEEGKTYVDNKLDPNDKDGAITSTCSATDPKTTYYVDNDGDGFGVDNTEKVLACTNPDPSKYTDNDSAFDCNDDDENINPDTEVTYYRDSDGDGYGRSGFLFPPITQSACDPAPTDYATNNDDCKDNDGNIHPDAEDDPTDGIDSNCDGEPEEGAATIWTGPGL